MKQVVNKEFIENLSDSLPGMAKIAEIRRKKLALKRLEDQENLRRKLLENKLYSFSIKNGKKYCVQVDRCSILEKE